MNSASDCLTEILSLDREMETLQSKINFIAEQAQKFDDYDDYQESIESYKIL